MAKASGAELRERWFDWGAAALARATRGAVTNRYRCPLCLKDFRRADATSGDALTIEDVPPANMGGKPLVLTCRTCNSTAGGSLDSHAGRLHAAKRFAAEDPTVFIPGVMRPEGKHLNVDIGHGANGELLFLGKPGGHDGAPAAFERLLEALMRGEEREFRFELRAGYDPRRVTLSMMRAAYLATFATLGYWYVYGHSETERLRAQLRAPDVRIISPTVVKTPSTLARRGLMLVNRPGALDGTIAVTIDDGTVLLPGWPADDWTFERLTNDLVRMATSAETAGFGGGELPWPRHPDFAVELDLLNGGTRFPNPRIP